MSRLISRDPFAREELHRRTVDVADIMGMGFTHSCDYCGNVKQTPTGRTYLFSYFTETDGGRTCTDSHLFCSKGCRDAYHS